MPSVQVSATTNNLTSGNSSCTMEYNTSSSTSKYTSNNNNLSVTLSSEDTSNGSSAVLYESSYNITGVNKAVVTFSYSNSGEDIELKHNLNLTIPTALVMQCFIKDSMEIIDIEYSTTIWTSNSAFIKMYNGNSNLSYLAIIEG